MRDRFEYVCRVRSKSNGGVVFEDNLMSEIGRACLIETGCKSRWWARCRHICTKFGQMELVYLILLRDVSVNGMVSLGMKIDRKVWNK